jgi:hypothetical protein
MFQIAFNFSIQTNKPKNPMARKYEAFPSFLLVQAKNNSVTVSHEYVNLGQADFKLLFFRHAYRESGINFSMFLDLHFPLYTSLCPTEPPYTSPKVSPIPPCCRFAKKVGSQVSKRK